MRFRKKLPATVAAGALVALGLVVAPEIFNRAPNAARSTRTRSTAAVLTPDISGDRQFSEERVELERQATAGDGRAARRIGLALANCNHYVPLSDAKLEELVVNTAAHGVTIRQDGHELTPEEVLTRLKMGLTQKARDCKGVSGLDEPDGSQQAFQWIERAAALGDADAQAIYGSIAFGSYDTRSALANAELIRERKRRAIDYLDRSLAHGDALALLHMSRHYAEGDLYPADDATSYAYLYAYSRTARASDFEPELLDQMLATSAGILDDETRERAQSQGLQLSACCLSAVSESQ